MYKILKFVFVIVSFQKYNRQFSLLINVTNSFNEPFAKNCIKIGWKIKLLNFLEIGTFWLISFQRKPVNILPETSNHNHFKEKYHNKIGRKNKYSLYLQNMQNSEFLPLLHPYLKCLFQLIYCKLSSSHWHASYQLWCKKSLMPVANHYGM